MDCEGVGRVVKPGLGGRWWRTVMVGAWYWEDFCEAWGCWWLEWSLIEGCEIGLLLELEGLLDGGIVDIEK